MSDCTKPVSGRIDGLTCRLESKPDGSDELLTFNPDTGMASLAVFREGQPIKTLFGRIKGPFLILSHPHEGKRWVRLAALLTLSMWLAGCSVTFDVPWPTIAPPAASSTR